jgi:hypothetical protein
MFHLSLFPKVFIASPVRVLPSVDASIASKAADAHRQFAFRDQSSRFNVQGKSSLGILLLASANSPRTNSGHDFVRSLTFPGVWKDGRRDRNVSADHSSLLKRRVKLFARAYGLTDRVKNLKQKKIYLISPERQGQFLVLLAVLSRNNELK